MLEFHELRPKPELRPWVQSLWMVRGSPALGPTSTRVLPFGGVDLVLDLGGMAAEPDAPSRSALALGPNHAPFHFAIARDACLLGVRFRYGGARQFLETPMAELARRGAVASPLRLFADAGIGRARVTCFILPPWPSPSAAYWTDPTPASLPGTPEIAAGSLAPPP